VAVAEVLDEGVSDGDHRGRAEPFQPAHRAQPSLQPSMIGFDPIVGPYERRRCRLVLAAAAV